MEKAFKNGRLTFIGSGDGSVMRVLTSHCCYPGSIPGITCGLSLFLVLVFAQRVFLPPQKLTF